MLLGDEADEFVEGHHSIAVDVHPADDLVENGLLEANSEAVEHVFELLGWEDGYLFGDCPAAVFVEDCEGFAQLLNVTFSQVCH